MDRVLNPGEPDWVDDPCELAAPAGRITDHAFARPGKRTPPKPLVPDEPDFLDE